MMTILLVIHALFGAILLIWLFLSQYYMHLRRENDCDLADYLDGLYPKFGIDATSRTFEQESLRMADGTCLRLYILRAGPEAPVYIFMPGTAVYAQIYAQILVDMHRRGFNVVSYDPRGHGRSGGLRGYFTVPQMIDDGLRIAAWAHREFGRPVVFSGSSQGGVVSFYLAATDSPDIATVVCHNIAWLDGNTIRQISILKPPLFLVPFLRALFLAMRAWSLPVTWYLPFNKLHLPNGQPAMPLMSKDPLITMAYSLQAIGTLVRTDLEVPIERITMPLMLVSSRGDEVFPVAYEQHLFDRLTCPKEFLLLGDLPHLMVMKPPREMIDGICKWSARHAPGRPAPPHLST